MEINGNSIRTLTTRAEKIYKLLENCTQNPDKINQTNSKSKACITHSR